MLGGIGDDDDAEQPPPEEITPPPHHPPTVRVDIEVIGNVTVLINGVPVT